MKKIQLIIKVTNGCNLRCKYCYNAEKGFKNDVISIDKIERLFHVFKGFDHYQIIFHGGEPLLGGYDFYDNVMDLEKYFTACYGTKFENLVQTNATLIDRKWIEYFKKNKFQPGISYDGIYNDSYRGQTEKVLRAVRQMQKEKFDIGCIAVVSDPNYDVLKNYEHFRNLNLQVDFNYVYNEGSAKSIDLLSIEDYTKQMISLFDYWIYDTDGIAVRNFDMILKKIFDCNFEYCSNGSCIGNFFCLDVDGSVYGCSREAVKKYCFGNISEFECLHDIVNTAGFLSYISGSINRRKVCQSTCEYFGYCKGGCPDDAIIHGDISKPNTDYCSFYTALFAHVKEKTDKILSEKTDLSTLNPHFRRALIQKLSIDEAD